MACHLYVTKRATTTFVLTENYDVVRRSQEFGECQISVWRLFEIFNSCRVEGEKNLEFSMFYERVFVERLIHVFPFLSTVSRDRQCT